MNSSVLVSGNRLRLVLVFAFAISFCILDYPEFCSLSLSSVGQASQVYTGGHYGTMQAGRDPINVLLYTRVQLFSLRRWAVIDPTAAATICQFDLRRRRHRTWWGRRVRGHRAGARVQRGITILSRGVNIKSRDDPHQLSTQPKWDCDNTARNTSALSTKSVNVNISIPWTERHTNPAVRRLKCGTFEYPIHAE